MNPETNTCERCEYLYSLDPSNTIPCFGCMWRKMNEGRPDYEWKKKITKRPKSPIPPSKILSYEEFKEIMAKEEAISS